MTYHPKEDLENPNAPEGEHPLKDFAILAVGSIALIALVIGLFMALGEGLTRLMSEDTERRLLGGRSWGFSAKPWPEGQAVLEKLIGESASGYTISLWCDDTPNAVALPGRQILVSEGLVKLISSENALAFVIAHEFGHFKQRDHLRGLGRGLGLSIGLAMLGLDGSGSGIAEIGAHAVARGYQRDQERGADLVAADLVTNAYGGLKGAGEFFEKMAARESGWSRASSFLATHPNSTERARLFEGASQGNIHPFVVPEICHPRK